MVSSVIVGGDGREFSETMKDCPVFGATPYDKSRAYALPENSPPDCFHPQKLHALLAGAVAFDPVRYHFDCKNNRGYRFWYPLLSLVETDGIEPLTS